MIYLSAYAGLYVLGSAVGPILYTYPSGRAAYNVMIAAVYALAFMASLLISAKLLGANIGSEWVIRYLAVPMLPYIVLIGYLIAAKDMASTQALQVLMLGVLYERLLIYIGGPTAIAVKVLGYRLGTVKSAFTGVLAGGSAYALVTLVMSPALKAASSALPWAPATLLVGLMGPVAALAIETIPLIVYR